MRAKLLLLFAPLAFLGSALPMAVAGRPPPHTKAQAEVNVLRVVGRKWHARRLPGLVNWRTHPLADNTEAVCRGRGVRQPGNRYASCASSGQRSTLRSRAVRQLSRATAKADSASAGSPSTGAEEDHNTRQEIRVRSDGSASIGPGCYPARAPSPLLPQAAPLRVIPATTAARIQEAQ
jgi:hypothetical protein